MPERLRSLNSLGPTMTLQAGPGIPQVSCEIDFLRTVKSHIQDPVVQCNAQILFLSRAAAEIEAVIDKRCDQPLSRADAAELALLEIQAMSYRVKSRLVGETCAPLDVKADMQDVFNIPRHRS